MEENQQNINTGVYKTINSNSINDFNVTQIPNELKVKESIPYDEPGLYHAFGIVCFSTATFLLGISNFNAYDNGKLLTVFGFFIGGLGQLICGIICFKKKYYIDGTVYFYFALNWTITGCYDLFPIWGWMDPLNGREYGYHNLCGCFFTLIFCLQNLGAPSILTRISFTTTFLGFFFGTIGSFKNSTGLMKTAGVFQIITAALAYYSAFAMTINERYKKVWMPVLDGKSFRQKLD